MITQSKWPEALPLMIMTKSTQRVIFGNNSIETTQNTTFNYRMIEIVRSTTFDNDIGELA